MDKGITALVASMPFQVTHTRIISQLVVPVALLACVGGAHAADTTALDIHTLYSTEEGGCDTTDTITWSAHGVVGDGFACTLGESWPAGTGLASYESSCVVDGKFKSDRVAFDLGNNPNHFGVLIPGRSWILMYPCTPVEGLEGLD